VEKGFDFREQLSVMARERLESSSIGEIIELAARHRALSFGAGEPSAELFPKNAIREAVAEAFAEKDVWGYYHDDFGYLPLREWICERMGKDGMAPSWVQPEHILLTNGGGEGVSLVSEALIDPGSVVLVESPTYVESLLTFRKQGAVCVPVPSDDEGIIPSELERIASAVRPRFLYTIPNFQNPSGRTIPEERRVQILEILRKLDFPMLEDDPYHYLSYDAVPPTSFLKLTGNDYRVAHCNSFSKTIAPGLRVGWLVVPPPLKKALHHLRVSAGLGRPTVIQAGIWRYLSGIDFLSRIEELCKNYRERRDAMMDGIKRFLNPLGIRASQPAGGFFIWCESPDSRDIHSFARYSVEEHGIAIIPGQSFFPKGDKRGDWAFRLSYAKVTAEQVEEGMQRLVRAWESYPAARATSGF